MLVLLNRGNIPHKKYDETKTNVYSVDLEEND